MDAVSRISDRTYGEVVGAKPIETVVMNSLTVNLHFLLVSFYRPTSERYKIVMEAGAFPSDQYAVKSQLKFHGFDVKESLIELEPARGRNTSANGRHRKNSATKTAIQSRS